MYHNKGMQKTVFSHVNLQVHLEPLYSISTETQKSKTLILEIVPYSRVQMSMLGSVGLPVYVRLWQDWTCHYSQLNETRCRSPFVSLFFFFF